MTQSFHFLLFISLWTSDASIKFRYRMLNLKETIIAPNPYKYNIEYFKVPVDHFNFANQDTFKIRYLINEDYWFPKVGAPIFFYTGNEGDIEMFANNTGFIWEIAPEFKALVVFAEHRYYGMSLPYGNKSFLDPDHWGYLTAEQAMADYIDLIVYLKNHKKHKLRPCGKVKNPVIAFGGSYGGMLAAWMRMKYPNAVLGSLSASAPILSFPGMVDCGLFFQITTSVYKSASDRCPENVKQLWKEIDKMTRTEEGRRWLHGEWSLCKGLRNKADGTILKGWLARTLVDVAMANYPYPASFLGDLPENPVKKFCNHLSQHSFQGVNLLGQVYYGLQEWFNYTGQFKCLDYSMVGPDGMNLEGWGYQFCTQMILPTCSDGVNDMFEPDPWNLSKVLKECEREYKRKPRPYFVENQYGGRDMKTVTNIIFSNGLLDPWSCGGVMRNLSKDTYAVLIPEGAHHLDLRASNPLDPESVVTARKFYKETFQKWIDTYFAERIMPDEL